tara:strand:- start:532 stop:699 length:168 start_codon:yes stop_codon:yes gene_type:complete
MYTQNIQKQLTVIAGVSGGLICEIESGDFKTLKAFKTELKPLIVCKHFAVMNITN